MANPGATKRMKERAREERRQDKQLERERRKANKPVRPVVPGEDPDLAGMVAGPQPVAAEDEM